MRIEKIGILLLSMTVLVTAGFVSNQAFAGVCDIGWIWDDVALICVQKQAVGGLAVAVSESEVYGELAKQYSLWLIPAISVIAIGTYLVKRKF